MGITCEALDKEISALKAGKMTWDTVKQLNLLLDLRAKLGDDPRNPRWLYTVHGVGYRFEAPEKPADAK